MFKVYGNENRYIETVETIQEFIRKGYSGNKPHAEDEQGFKYYQDGTGLGFRACKMLYKDLDRVPFYGRNGIYLQEKCKFEHILSNAREIKDTFGLSICLEYINRLRNLKE
jgi:hypothetical protein